MSKYICVERGKNSLFLKKEKEVLQKPFKMENILGRILDNRKKSLEKTESKSHASKQGKYSTGRWC